jgi:hypothetical protein
MTKTAIAQSTAPRHGGRIRTRLAHRNVNFAREVVPGRLAARETSVP